MTAPNDWDDRIEAMLKQPYIDDGGFTARVVESLPPKRSGKRRTLVIGVFSALACLAALISPVGTLLPEAVRSALTLPKEGAGLPVVGWVFVGLIVWAALALARTEEA